jgi:hypothetical protein
MLGSDGTVKLAASERDVEAITHLAQHWPGPDINQRRLAYLALSGGLLRDGVTVERAEALVEVLADATEDEKAGKRLACLKSAAEQRRKGGKTSGWPTLAKMVTGEGAIAAFRRFLGLAINLDDLAAHKRLPVHFLKQCGLHDLPLGGVGIPYRDAAGKTLEVKERRALRAGDGSRWPWGRPLLAYGEDHLDLAVTAGYQVLVEGESDALTLWHHDLPGLGLPGAATVEKTLHLAHVGCVRIVYVVEETDAAGKDFIARVQNRLAVLGWNGELKVLRLPAKDVSELHLVDPATFPARWKEALAQAVPASSTGLPPPTWPEPVPLGEAPSVPSFPLDVLPVSARELISEVAQALPCPTDYPAVPLLVMAGGAIGASRALEIKPGHIQGARLYAGVVGPPGSAKTPALELVVEPVHEAEESIYAAWEAAMERYEEELEDYEAAKKVQKKEGGEPPEKPKRPILERLTVNDATAEALVPILKENPHGVVLVRDELTGWVQAMNQYREGGKGADQQFWLSAWSGSTVTVDRKKTHDLGPLRVRHPFVSVIGGLTPDKLLTLRGDKPRQKAEQDGFIDRVLLSYPAEPAVVEENWQSVGETTRAKVRDLFAKLRSLEMVPVQVAGTVTGMRPYVVKLTACGMRAWQELTRQHAQERNAEDFPPILAGPWSKLRGYCARLALILHFLRWAGGELDSDKADVDGHSMKAAANLIAYFKAHARKVYAIMDADPMQGAARRLLRWIEQNGLERFTRREAYRTMRGAFCRSVDAIDPILAILENHGFIRPVPADDAPRPGRKASQEYLVHPSLCGHFGQNGQNCDAGAGGEEADGDSVHCVQSVQGCEGEIGAGTADGDVWEGEVA